VTSAAAEGIPVTVGIPALNEEQKLPALLEDLAAQSHAPSQVIVVDGGSTDGTVAAAGRFSGRGVHVVRLSQAFPGRGRNRAAADARHSWIAFTDAGCRVGPEWLAELLRPLESASGELDVVFGAYEPETSTDWEAAQALAMVAPVDPETGCRGPSTASMLIRREMWTRVGGFPEDLRAAEDLLFFRRLAEAKARTAWAPGAVARWTLSPGPRAYFRRLRRYSAHHLAAGLGRTWHARVAAMDLAALALALAALRTPILLALLLAGGLLRLARTVWIRRGNVREPLSFRPRRLAMAALLVALADAAMWLGALDHLRGKAR
jgi:glycosyltransferase involved in cell wall biosynthesis